MRHFTAFILLWLLAPLVLAQSYIPANAYLLRSMVISEVDTHFPTIPERSYVPALIEHESCISLSHSKCWNAKSRLKTQREEGAGVGQITRAYNPDGSVRFDSLTEMMTRHRKELAAASWDTIYQRPDIQIRMLVLMTRDNYLRLYDIVDPFQRLAMTDIAYNGGMGGLQKERRLCSLTKGCDPGIWFGHVEKYCLKSKKVLYGNRSACQINRFHAVDVMKTRLVKYSRLGFMD